MLPRDFLQVSGFGISGSGKNIPQPVSNLEPFEGSSNLITVNNKETF
jgi:hypothetical protein